MRADTTSTWRRSSLGREAGRGVGWSEMPTVLLQPAEEIPFGEESGARAILKSGVIDVGEVDAVVGLHCWPWLPESSLSAPRCDGGERRAQFGDHGATTHAATPANRRDALLAIGHLVVPLHSQVFRRIYPADQVAVRNRYTRRAESVPGDTARLSREVREGPGYGVGGAHGLGCSQPRLPPSSLRAGADGAGARALVRGGGAAGASTGRPATGRLIWDARTIPVLGSVRIVTFANWEACPMQFLCEAESLGVFEVARVSRRGGHRATIH